MDSFSRRLLLQVPGGQVLLPSTLFSANLTSNSPVSSRVRSPSLALDGCSIDLVLVDREPIGRRRPKCHCTQHQSIQIGLVLTSGP